MNYIKNDASFVRRITFIALRFFILSFLLFLLPASGFARYEQDISIAPTNPAFAQFVSDYHSGKLNTVTNEGRPLGRIPSPFVREIEKRSSIQNNLKTIVAYPSEYDLRDTGKVTIVKDQGQCGSCWTFGAYASLESALLPSETWNFSENNLKNKSGFDLGCCDGGNDWMSMAYLSRWSGPVNEADDPYEYYSCVSPNGVSAQKHVQEVILPGSSLAEIKDAIMNYGALATSIYYDNSYYNYAHSAYYFPDEGYYPNHEVAIVGWDDNYPLGNFAPYTPSANGAFIVKNSWGPGWGDGGYFYISYEDSYCGYENAGYYNAESTANYEDIYQYDPLGASDLIGASSSSYLWGANIFTARAQGQIKAVSFYTLDSSVDYEVSVYNNVASNPTSGTLAGTKTGSINVAGYHTIVLDSPVSISEGEKYSIVVKITNLNDFAYQHAIEEPYDGYSSAATASPGQSFYSLNGSSWTDLTSAFPNSNFCIKAFTDSTVSTTAPTVTTNAATGITQTAATLNGVITAIGGSPVDSYGFDWGTSSSSLTNHIEVGVTSPGSTPFSFNSDLTGLTPDRIYYFKAFAHNADGTSANTDIKSFTTLENNPPSVTTNTATNIIISGATLNGVITAIGGSPVDSYGFDWGTSSYSLTNHIEVGVTSPGSVPFSFNNVLTGLTSNKTYYYMAYAHNSGGTSTSATVKRFTTLKNSPPSVTTNAATDITQTGATLNGVITSIGGSPVDSYGFDWGTSSYSLTNHIEVGVTNPGSTPFNFNTVLTGLTPYKTYYFKAYAHNAGGKSTNTTVKRFTTLKNSPPSVTTNAATDRTKTSATLNGVITAIGGSPVDSYGFDWGTISSSLTNHIEVGVTNPGSTPFNFNTVLTGLTCNRTYYFKAYAHNSAGTSYGSIKYFTTLTCNGSFPKLGN
ncbi:MAG: lectin like domain-containing protein [Eubacteriales bacterium]